MIFQMIYHFIRMDVKCDYYVDNSPLNYSIVQLLYLLFYVYIL